VTRAGDQYNITTASINYGASAGSWWVDAQVAVFLTGARVLGMVPGGNTFIYEANSTQFSIFTGSGGLAKTVASVTGAHKIAVAFATADRAITADGLTVVADALAPGTMLTATSIFFGSETSSSHMNGYIRKVHYVPRRKTNPEMVTETI
jgi:hypothetical protein